MDSQVYFLFKYFLKLLMSQKYHCYDKAFLGTTGFNWFTKWRLFLRQNRKSAFLLGKCERILVASLSLKENF